MSKVTIGEALARRKLKKSKVGHLEIYQPGQHKASKLSDEDALVSFVNIHGGLVIMPCEWRDGEGFHKGLLIEATPITAEVRRLRRENPLAAPIQELLRNVFDPPKKEEDPPPQDKTAGDPQPPQDLEG